MTEELNLDQSPLRDDELDAVTGGAGSNIGTYRHVYPVSIIFDVTSRWADFSSPSPC